MEVSSSCNLEYDDETRALKGLLDIFGAACNLRDISAAFCKAGRNFEVAAEILSGSSGCSSISSTHMSLGESRAAVLSEQLSENISKACADRDSKVIKPRKHSASVGTVSSVIGKGYSKPTTLSSGLSQTSKPMKVNLNEFQLNEVQGDGVLLDHTTRKDTINSDVEQFLFKMLGEGFQLGKDVIHGVLGSCGYDANKSIEKLIDISASTLNRSDDIVGGFAENSAGEETKQKYLSCEEKSGKADYSRRNGAKLVSQESNKHDLPREVLTSLFSAPNRSQEPPRKTLLVRAVKKTRSYGKVVSEPLRDRDPTFVPDFLEPPKDTDADDDEEEDSYQVLRRVAKEHWITMKEYYKAAVDAFANGNQTLADELLQQGQFFNNKAREADEKSSQKIFECSTKENRDEVILDLHDHDAKEAIRTLKFHLRNLSGIHTIQNLKVILETDGEDITKGSRRRRVLKLLERESIKWTEEGGTIIIKVDEIDPDGLSFARKAE